MAITTALLTMNNGKIEKAQHFMLNRRNCRGNYCTLAKVASIPTVAFVGLNRPLLRKKEIELIMQRIKAERKQANYAKVAN